MSDMQENNLETQVQQKMEELKISPSAGVWEKVTLGIEKRRRNWRLIYIFSLLFLLIGASSIIWWNVAKVNSTVVIPSNKKIVANKEKEGNKTEDNLVKPVTTDASLKENIEEVIEKVTPSIKEEDQKKNLLAGNLLKESNLNTISKQVPNKNDNSNNNNLDQHKITYDATPKTSIQANHANIGENEISEVPETNHNEDVSVEEALYNERSVYHSFPKFIDKNIAVNKAKDIKHPGTEIEMAYVDLQFPKDNKLIPRKEKHPWKFGFNVSAGLSATRNSYLGIVGNAEADKGLVYSSPSTNPNNGSTGSAVVITPSPIKINKSFITGLYAQKQFTARASFLVGLNYKYYSTTMTVGYKVDSFSNLSSSAFYYRSGNSVKYFNRYHFIELPAGILYRLGKPQNKLPVYLYAGVSISQLIKTTALQFDNASGAYYSNNDIFNKTQVGLSGRLLFSILKPNRNPLLIGPDLNYSLTRMAGTGLYSNRHYSYFGIHLQKGIGKK